MFNNFIENDYRSITTSLIAIPSDQDIASILGIPLPKLAKLPEPVPLPAGVGFYLALDKKPRSDAAQRLVQTLLADATPTGRRMTAEMRKALGALLGDLLAIRVTDQVGYGFRLMGSDYFAHQRVGRKPFKAVIKRLHSAEYIQVVAGAAAPPVAGYKGRATTIQPRPALFDLAESYGINPKNWKDHFEALVEPVALRASSERGLKDANGRWLYGKTRGVKLGVDYRHPVASRSAERVTAINEALSTATFNWPDDKVSGAPFLQRIFNQGIVGKGAASYGYDLGGRLYTRHGYQGLTKKVRAGITIDDESTCEVDISGSYYTIAMALLGMPIDRTVDCYFVKGFPRIIVKAYVNSSLGNGKPIGGWPKEMKEEYALADTEEKPNRYKKEVGTCYTGDLQKDFPIATIKDHVLPCFPMLSLIEEAGIDWARLSYIESCAILDSVYELTVELGVPCLPMHDAIICPVSKAALVEEVLSRHFLRYVGVEPKLSRS